MKLLVRILFVGFLFTLAACGEEEEKYIIPSSPVNFKVNVNVQDKELATAMATKTFTSPRLAGEYTGYSGLLVVCSAVPITGSIYELYAYDLCCPHEKQVETKVQPQTDGTAKCPKCGSVYDIISGVGNVKSDPSENNLQRYSARYSNSEPGVFYITR